MTKNENERNTITRSDLVDAITDEFHITRYDASEIIEDILEGIQSALVRGENVKISGFGSFLIHKKKERMGRNPKTMKEAVISSRRSLSFRASSFLKKIVNENNSGS